MTMYRLLLLLLLSGAFLAGCQRVIIDEESSPFSAQIQQVAPQPILDSLAKYAVPINPGKTPPLIDSIYFLRQNLLINSNYSRDKDSLNIKIFSNYKYRFSNQSQVNLTVKLDYKSFLDDAGMQPGGDQGGGTNGFLSGSGNLFTLFIETVGTEKETRNGRTLTATYKYLQTFSGEVTPVGINGLVNSFYLKEKTDPDNIIVPVGTIRVFKDKDGFSEKISTFRIIAPKNTESVPIHPLARGNR